MAILKCKYKCFYNGRVVKEGQLVDVDDADMGLDIVVSSFVIPKDAEAAKEALDTQPDPTLTKKELQRRLDEMNIRYKPNATKPELEALYNEQFEDVSAESEDDDRPIEAAPAKEEDELEAKAEDNKKKDGGGE